MRGGSGAEAKDALLQVLAEQNETLVAHLGHVAELASLTAIGMDLRPSEVELTRLAAELHDVGKAAIPASILDKPGALDARRAALHASATARSASASSRPHRRSRRSRPIVRSAHERVDGTGYPDGLTLDEIPIGVAHHRGRRRVRRDDERPALSQRDAVDAALAELRRHAGTQFDPAVVEAFAVAMTDRLVVPRAA